MEARKLKVVVIKEELFSITGDTFEAIILSQLLYWQDRVNDVDKFIIEERNRNPQLNEEESTIQLTNGWMYKTAKDLKDECMLSMSEVTIRRYLLSLIKKRFVECRKNPANKWDRTLQYRVNLKYVILKIKSFGFDGLSGYKLQEVDMKLQNEESYQRNEEAIPYTTNIDYNRDKEEKDKSFSKKERAQALVDLWNNETKDFPKVRKVSPDVLSDIDKLLKRGYSYEDIKKAIILCNSLSEFYKGEKRGNTWKATFQWLVHNTKNNFDRIMNGALHTSEEQQKIYQTIITKGIESLSNTYMPYVEYPYLWLREEDGKYYFTGNIINLADGYTKDNRPNGAEVHQNGYTYTWNSETKEWERG